MINIAREAGGYLLRGSGNACHDLGVADPEAEELRAQLAANILNILDLTAQAAQNRTTARHKWTNRRM